MTFKDLSSLLPKAEWERAAFEGSGQYSSQSFRATLGSLRPEALKTLNWKFCTVYDSCFRVSVQWKTCFSGSLSALLLFSFQPLYAPAFLARCKSLCNLRALQSWHSSFCSCMVLYVLYNFTQFKLDGKRISW